jgi:CRISPR-associated protein Cas1
VYDLIEPFRWLVAYAVYKIASDTNHNHPITKRDYAWTREGRVVLDDDLIRRFLELLERKFQSERPYKFKHGIKRRDGLSMCRRLQLQRLTFRILRISVAAARSGMRRVRGSLSHNPCI